jgi:multidrug efflux pump subunit AcrA (membrane-fusion protein)
VDIALDSTAPGELSEAPVTVNLENGKKENVLTVPVTALLALGEGGYGVQIVHADGSDAVVPVSTGMFADGRVEVSGPGLKAGARVGVAS